MTENKRKARELTKSNNSHSKTKSSSFGGKKKKNKKDERKGPRLPNSLLRELNPDNPRNTNEDEQSSEDDQPDVYEYDEPLPEEETHKNKRYDPVDNFEYELPEEFEDENLSSDDDEDDNDGRHSRMLQGITGMPAEAFDGSDKNKKFVVVSETYPESEFNPSRDALDGDGHISIQDLLDPLQKKRGYSQLRKRVQQVETKSTAVQTPLAKVVQQNVERKVAYKHAKELITEWEPLVKRNREAPTIFFDQDVDVGSHTVGAIASNFKPRSEFEKKIDSLFHDSRVVEAHKDDGARILELNEVSVEDVKDRQNRLAKMRSILFRHEMKSKHIKKIKSKTYHRLQKKDKLKAAHADIQTDPEAAKELAMKQEFKRAEERMTLKHKNTSKWAKHILERGLSAQDEGTRIAITEQLHQHAILTRKMNTMKDSSSSEESSEEDEDDDDLSPSTEQDRTFKLLTNAKEKTVKVIEEENEIPKSGVLSLPFMVRGLKKREEEANAEAKLALEEYESQLNQIEDGDDAGSPKASTLSGRRVFGATMKQHDKSEDTAIMKNIGRDSDSEDEFKSEDNVGVECVKNHVSLKEVHVDVNMFHDESDDDRNLIYKNLDNTTRDPGPKTTHEVAMFASNSWKKMGDKKQTNGKGVESGKDRGSLVVEKPALPQDLKEVDEDEDTESEEEMVDGILSKSAKPDYELPSQEELIRSAFAADDVEEEFEKEKLDVLNEENPEPEKPVLLPGWGQWTHIQKKKGLPSWMQEEHENAKKKREESLKKRKDADLKHVIISEKINKKAEKLHTKTLPFPFTSKEVFEQSIRVPIGPEFNPATSVGALIRPEVVKKPGVIIKPIKFEKVNPHDKEDQHKANGQNQKTKNHSSCNGKSTNKSKRKQKN